ncbi:hypothetical protein [Streptomyces cavernicola]|uniref:Uncharacterized protein n=1 Tax=Streptomyces cavernicola TaxID=3043613 RepID=A0ABT6SHC7_9ACTN|nr:hypothetical protein [Streptomyces sp. B-S-A6]MDI3406661.1 hypothetical protein [Streptomyces sp. B-S-A6]
MGARHAADRRPNDHERPEPRTGTRPDRNANRQANRNANRSPNRPPAGPPNHPPNRHARPGTSLPQLVGSGLAAAAAMALASELKLYGTTAGAVVFAVAATAGAPLIQLALHRAADGCAALLRAAGRARRQPGPGRPRRALAPMAVGALLLGAVAVTAPTAVAAAQPAEVALDHPPARDPAERGSTDKAPTVRSLDVKSLTPRGS